MTFRLKLLNWVQNQCLNWVPIIFTTRLISVKCYLPRGHVIIKRILSRQDDNIFCSFCQLFSLIYCTYYHPEHFLFKFRNERTNRGQSIRCLVLDSTLFFSHLIHVLGKILKYIFFFFKVHIRILLINCVWKHFDLSIFRIYFRIILFSLKCGIGRLWRVARRKKWFCSGLLAWLFLTWLDFS